MHIFIGIVLILSGIYLLNKSEKLSRAFPENRPAIFIDKPHLLIVPTIIGYLLIIGGIASFFVLNGDKEEPNKNIIQEQGLKVDTEEKKENAPENKTAEIQEEDADSTTQENVKQQKATGTIKIYYEREGTEFKEISKDHNLEGQTLIKSTRFLDSKTGYLYRLTESVVVPSGYIVSAPVQADVYGEKYILDCSVEDPCTFSIPGFKGTHKYDLIYGKAVSGFSF